MTCVLVACSSFGPSVARVDLTALHGPAGVAHCKLPVKHKTSQTDYSQKSTLKVALSMCN